MKTAISENGLALIKRFEGCRLTSYQDSAGVWTIGYGHTSGVSRGQTITQTQADAYLRADCANAEKAVNRYTDIYHWNQNQFDALVSFTFNCGAGNLNTLLDRGQRSIAQISGKIPAYRKAGGRVLQGLINRRTAEKALFDTPVPQSGDASPTPTYLKPVIYLQTDPRWKAHNYSARGEQKTIGSSGCGVAVSAMVIATLKDPSVTPVTTAEWSMSHGYKALNQGTYYSYFVPQLSAYGISCEQLNHANLYGTPVSPAHEKALHTLQSGGWIIACMGKGNWTSAGHFILLHRYENGSVYINDPASTKETRTKNTWDLFAGQVKYMWAVHIPGEAVSLTGL